MTENALGQVPLEPSTGRVETLEAAARHIREYRGHIRERVSDAREAGASWGEIAACLRVSRQAAWRRFRQHCRNHQDPGRDERRVEGNLRAVRHYKERSDVLSDRMFDLVRAARRAGRTWEEIAAELGVSKQSAWEHYARGRPLTPEQIAHRQYIEEVLRRD